MTGYFKDSRVTFGIESGREMGMVGPQADFRPMIGGMAGNRRGTTSVIRVCTGLGAICVVGFSCSSQRGGFLPLTPDERISTAREAVAENDLGVIPDLIEGLESDDPAVRLMSVEALRRLTGRRFDYDPYAPSWVRRKSVEAWMEAYENGALTMSQHAGAAR